MSFAAKHLGFAYGLRDVSFDLPPAGLIAIAGPNGAGKSTLLGIMAGLRGPYSGSCTYTGREIKQWPRTDLARHLAFLPQLVSVEFPFTAEEIVLMGRTPRSGGWYESPDDRAAAQHALSISDALPFRTRDFRSLSGGERQRVLLAAALAQEPQALLLDEPATHLDLRHQLALYRLLARLARSMLIVAVTHDLNLALQFATRALVLADGRIAADGAPGDALSTQIIGDVFGVVASIETNQRGQNYLSYDA